ncbi:hypothetical protein EJB05_25048, partial [Eragrostis curvula]
MSMNCFNWFVLTTVCGAHAGLFIYALVRSGRKKQAVLVVFLSLLAHVVVYMIVSCCGGILFPGTAARRWLLALCGEALARWLGGSHSGDDALDRGPADELRALPLEPPSMPVGAAVDVGAYE